ncbi:hypothetical protein BaRGS_00005492 [Batillaria attramentaria]|uniref:Uncharacterized protein n=1 Tax=Batillaria attramentaria TaxID=370345 RepID=A0ABD0LV45_9CAEN
MCEDVSPQYTLNIKNGNSPELLSLSGGKKNTHKHSSLPGLYSNLSHTSSASPSRQENDRPAMNLTVLHGFPVFPEAISAELFPDTLPSFLSLPDPSPLSRTLRLPSASGHKQIRESRSPRVWVRVWRVRAR